VAKARTNEVEIRVEHLLKHGLYVASSQGTPYSHITNLFYLILTHLFPLLLSSTSLIFYFHQCKLLTLFLSHIINQICLKLLIK